MGLGKSLHLQTKIQWCLNCDGEAETGPKRDGQTTQTRTPRAGTRWRDDLDACREGRYKVARRPGCVLRGLVQDDETTCMRTTMAGTGKEFLEELRRDLQLSGSSMAGRKIKIAIEFERCYEHRVYCFKI